MINCGGPSSHTAGTGTSHPAPTSRPTTTFALAVAATVRPAPTQTPGPVTTPVGSTPSRLSAAPRNVTHARPTNKPSEISCKFNLIIATIKQKNTVYVSRLFLETSPLLSHNNRREAEQKRGGQKFPMFGW